VNRREFITLLGGAATWPFAARAQQPERMRRIGVLVPAAADDPVFQARVGAFLQGLAVLDWSIGRNVRVDARWAITDAAEIRRHAAELVALAPDVILASGTTKIAPGVTRVAVLRDAAVSIGPVQFGVIQAVAPSLRVDINPINMRDAGEIERAIAAFAGSPNGGLILTAGAMGLLHRDLIVTLAARHKLPAVYPYRHFVTVGGLISYGADYTDQYRRAAISCSLPRPCWSHCLLFQRKLPIRCQWLASPQESGVKLKLPLRVKAGRITNAAAALVVARELP
jgi:putative ABC transport system substrate-binding protein